MRNRYIAIVGNQRAREKYCRMRAWRKPPLPPAARTDTSPCRPGKNIGQENDADTERGHQRRDCNLRRAVAESRAGLQIVSFFQKALDILDGYSSVVHQNADRKRESAQRHDVDGLMPSALSRQMEVRIESGIETAMITVLRQLPRKIRIIAPVRQAAIIASRTTPFTAARTNDRLIRQIGLIFKSRRQGGRDLRQQ